MKHRKEKLRPPAVTVKAVVDAGGVRVGWWVRQDGAVVGRHAPDEAGKRAALRQKDALLHAWHTAQRTKAGVAQLAEAALGYPLRPYQKAVLDYLVDNPDARLP